MFEKKLFARLGFVTNLYPLVAPDKFATPAVVYARNGTVFTKDLDDDDTGQAIDLQIDVYDDDYIVALDLADTIRVNLKAWNTDGVQAATQVEEMHLIDDTTETILYRVMLRFAVYIND